MNTTSRLTRCQLGYSWLQVAILSVLSSPHEVLAYWQIAQIVCSVYKLKTTEGAVRGAVERLSRYNLFVGKRTTRGHLKGKRYAFLQNPCPHIYQMHQFVELHTQSNTQSDVKTTASILEEIEINKNLSISSRKTEEQRTNRLETLTEEDIAFHWPELAKLGFSTCQIRQIIYRLEQIYVPSGNVLLGLTHAEWELEHKCMVTKKGDPISNPLNWVFSILAKQGYYPRPVDYVSPQEKAEVDKAFELQRCKEALERCFKAECELWATSLSVEQRSEILRPKNGMYSIAPEEVILHNYFRTQVWSERQKKSEDENIL